MIQNLHYPVRVEALRKYWNQSTIYATLGLWVPCFLFFLAIINKKDVSAATSVPHFIIWFVILPMVILYFSIKSVPTYIDALSYRLEGNVLRVDEGYLNRKQKAIPIDLISEIRLNEGWMMRQYGVTMLSISTVAAADGTGAILWGVKNPEDLRDTLLRMRNEATGNIGRNQSSLFG